MSLPRELRPRKMLSRPGFLPPRLKLIHLENKFGFQRACNQTPMQPPPGIAEWSLKHCGLFLLPNVQHRYVGLSPPKQVSTRLGSWAAWRTRAGDIKTSFCPPSSLTPRGSSHPVGCLPGRGHGGSFPTLCRNSSWGPGLGPKSHRPAHST